MDATQYSIADFRNSDDLFAQELRLMSPGGDRFDWVVGAYYLDHDTSEDETETLMGLTTFFPDFGFLTDQIVDFGRSAKIKDLAVFGEVTWHATDRMHVTGGLRWFDTSVDADQHYTDPSTLSDFSGEPTSYSDQDTILKLNLSYDLADDLMTYATWSQGYRRGGANSLPTTEPPDIQTFRPDQVENYEIGLKGIVAKDYRFSVAGYYIDWKDVQIATFSPVSFLDAAINGGDATSYGVELELSASPWDHAVVSLAYAYTNAELAEDFSVADGNFTASEGSRLPGTPEHMVTGSIDVSQSVSRAEIEYHLDASYTSETVNEVSRTPLVGEFREFDGFLTLGARIAVTMDRWTFGVFGENLTNEEGVTAQSALIAIPDQAFEWIIRPRTFGAFVELAF
ncbi:MAG: TonB-dependent receptor [Proteobacteria bacterium]|nr:TonB-dependent receptor [Pseudomonadota bacterium]